MTALATWQIVNARVPLAIDNRSHDVPIVDQGSEGSCSAQAAVDVCEIAEKRQGNSVTLSRNFQYYNERLLENTTTQDMGASAGDVFKALAQYGCCLESTWPYGGATLYAQPPANCYTEALQHQVTSYAALPISQIQTAVAMGYPVLFSMNVRQALQTITGNQKAQSAQFANYLNSQYLGGHFMVVEGYDNTAQTYTIRNSWGTQFGDSGYCYMPYSCFNADVQTAWVILGYNGFPMPTLQPLPPQTRVYLDSSEVFSVDSPCVIYGGTTRGAVILMADAKNVVCDSNIATVSIPAYTIDNLGYFQQGAELVIEYGGTILVTLNTNVNVLQTLILGNVAHTLLRQGAVMTLDGAVI